MSSSDYNHPVDYSAGAPYPNAPYPNAPAPAPAPYQYPAYTYPGDPSNYSEYPSAPPPSMPPPAQYQAPPPPTSYPPEPYQPSYPAVPEPTPYPTSSDVDQPIYAKDANGNIYTLPPGTKVEPGQKVVIVAESKKPEPITNWERK